MFREDVRDTLFDLIFDRFRINLLSAPRTGVVPGSMIAVVGKQAFGPLSAARALKDVNLPAFTTERVTDIEERSTNIRETKVQLNFLQKMFAHLFPPEIAPELSAKANASGAAEAYARFSEVYRDHIELVALADAIFGKRADLDRFAVEPFTLYIISDVYRAKGLKMFWLDEHGHDVGAKVGVPSVASIEGSATGKSWEKGSLGGAGIEVVFGVRLLPIVVENGQARLKLDHAPVRVLAEQEASEDYVLLGQETFLELLDLPSEMPNPQVDRDG